MSDMIDNVSVKDVCEIAVDLIDTALLLVSVDCNNEEYFGRDAGSDDAEKIIDLSVQMAVRMFNTAQKEIALSLLETQTGEA